LIGASAVATGVGAGGATAGAVGVAASISQTISPPGIGRDSPMSLAWTAASRAVLNVDAKIGWNDAWRKSGFARISAGLKRLRYIRGLFRGSI
jgi:hypothetical protein